MEPIPTNPWTPQPRWCLITRSMNRCSSQRWVYAVKVQRSLAPLSWFPGSRKPTAHVHQCCRFQSYAKSRRLHAIANEIYIAWTTFLGSTTTATPTDHVTFDFNSILQRSSNLTISSSSSLSLCLAVFLGTHQFSWSSSFSKIWLDIEICFIYFQVMNKIVKQFVKIYNCPSSHLFLFFIHWLSFLAVFLATHQLCRLSSLSNIWLDIKIYLFPLKIKFQWKLKLEFMNAIFHKIIKI